MIDLRIFLASSEELESERLALAGISGRLRCVLEDYEISISITKWEYLDSSMGVRHKQEEYNDSLRQCDACVVLYWRKCGKYTLTEQNVALRELGPTNVHILFKECAEQSLEFSRFRRECETRYPRQCKEFSSSQHLLQIFCDIVVHTLRMKLSSESEYLAERVEKILNINKI